MAKGATMIATEAHPTLVKAEIPARDLVPFGTPCGTARLDVLERELTALRAEVAALRGECGDGQAPAERRRG